MHSVDVLLRIYAKCIAGQDELAKRRITEALRDGWPQMTASGRTQPHIVTALKIAGILRFRRSKPLAEASMSGAGGARTHDRRIMSPARQQLPSGRLT